MSAQYDKRRGQAVESDGGSVNLYAPGCADTVGGCRYPVDQDQGTGKIGTQLEGLGLAVGVDQYEECSLVMGKGVCQLEVSFLFQEGRRRIDFGHGCQPEDFIFPSDLNQAAGEIIQLPVLRGDVPEKLIDVVRGIVAVADEAPDGHH
jgi:hypothetical protein